MKIGVASGFLACVLAGAAIGPPPAHPSAGPEMASHTKAKLRQAAFQRAEPLQIDYQRSILVAKLTRAGLLRFLGHEHGVVPGAWSATVRFDPADLDGSSIVVQIDAAALVIDSDDARRLAGVDAGGPSEEETHQISGDMHSSDYLDSAAFPTIRFQSTALRIASPPAEGSSTALRIDGTLTLHGVSREVSVDAELSREAGGYVARGTFEIAQRDFGIEPASIGGVVKVANEVEIRFEVFAAVPVAR